jgi:tRNA/tmRNA/rRNA uracil-C5-methylase (TrmA/RlmC/RlmD family)
LTTLRNSGGRKYNPIPYEYHTELVLEIEGLDDSGSGIAHHNGRLILVPLCIPGEKVLCRIYKNHEDYSESDLVEVLSPAPSRVEPKCQYFSKCMGCQFQHISIEYQRYLKRNRVKALLQVTGISNLHVNDIVGSEEHYNYRSKLTPHYSNPRMTPQIGFQSRFSNRQVVDIPECIIATPAINRMYQSVRKHLNGKFLNTSSSKGATLLFRDTCGDSFKVETDNRATVSQVVNGLEFKYQAGEFFQTNPFVLSLLVNHVVKQASSYGSRCLIDAYCGCGLFALSAASKFSTVIGIEINQSAVNLAEHNASLNKITNASFVSGKVENLFQTVRGDVDPQEAVVVIDPPRKGCTVDFLGQLFEFAPRVIVYVACDPATQARDAKLIVEAGYAIVDVTPFDMFPQTKHIETVITFSQK